MDVSETFFNIVFWNVQIFKDCADIAWNIQMLIKGFNLKNQHNKYKIIASRIIFEEK